jgi:F-type H+-transporting ATPase subunit b
LSGRRLYILSSLGSTMIALADDGRLFGLDYQLLFDASITAINVFILFILLSFILFNPVRNMLKKRQDKITSDRENAEADKKEALAMKQEYEAKLKAANKEAEGILSDARKVAKHNEEKIVADAKQEAARIIARANTEAELEKQKAADEVKQQIIAVARLMASKVVAESISEADSQALIEQTLNEMGDKTWLS